MFLRRLTLCWVALTTAYAAGRMSAVEHGAVCSLVLLALAAVMAYEACTDGTPPGALA